MNNQNQNDILMIIDSNALVHRAYHALPSLTSPSGVLTNAAFGYFLILFKAIEEIKPKYIVATFDVAAKTFRHEMFDKYKATRIKAPDNLYAQIPIVKEILQNMNIKILEAPGYEADDIIGTVVQKMKHNTNLDIIIVTGDLDTLQLIDNNVKVWTLKTGISQSFLYDYETFRKKYGMEPFQFVDYKGLKGDPSDNIPGIEGIGDKTAKELISKHHTIEELLKDAKDIVDDPLVSNKDKKIYKKILEYKDEALFSKQLASISLDVPIDFTLDDMRYQINNNSGLQETLKKYGFYSLIRKIDVKNTPKTSYSVKNIFDYQQITISNIVEANKYLASATCIYLMLDPDNNLYFSFVNSENKIIVFSINNTKIKDLQLPKAVFVTFDAKQLYKTYPNIFGDIFFEDLKIMSWLIDPEKKDYSFPAIAKQFIKEKQSNYHFFQNFEISDLIALMPELYQKILFNINNNKLDIVWNKIEKPLIRVLANMEENGIGLDKKYLETLLDDLKPQIQKLEKEIYKLAGQEFNINSPKQLTDILFNVLKINTKGLAKTSVSKAVSTNSIELEKIKNEHPIIDLILKYRELNKLVTAFILPLPSFISSKDQKIHAIFQQTGTATGRLSSDSPNLQNIPTRKDYGTLVRKAFIPSPGYLFVSFDYSQMELRIAAFLSQDNAMLKSFKEGKDFHTYTASLIFDVPYDKVTKDQRSKVKALNFGIVYGMGPKAFAQTAGISKEEATKYIEDYFIHYYKLKDYIDTLKDNAKAKGYCETLFGRKRFLPFIGVQSREGADQERIAINMPFQGLAADLIKISMVKIFDYLKENQLLDFVKLNVQIHDELLFEIKSDIINEIIPTIQRFLEDNELGVPLKVNISIGNNWGDLK